MHAPTTPAIIDPELLMLAYRSGIFPWPAPGLPLSLDATGSPCCESGICRFPRGTAAAGRRVTDEPDTSFAGATHPRLHLKSRHAYRGVVASGDQPTE